MAFDPEALKAAMESARRKSELGDNTTDQVLPAEQVREQAVKPDVDLTTNYMGLELPAPLVASAGPLSQHVEDIQAMADAGVGAVVLFSLFEEQVKLEQARATAEMEVHAESFAEALSYFPTEPSNESGLVHNYLKLIQRASSAIDVPLIASLNTPISGDSSDISKRMVDAGASAIELNVYFVPGSVRDPREVEDAQLRILESVKNQVDVPVAMKMMPYFSSFGHLAKRLSAAGADGLVLFNRWLGPDVELDRLEYHPGFELSTPNEGKLPRAWISALRGEVDCSLAGSGGVETSDDIVKYILSGADVVMTTAALVRHGVAYASQLIEGLGRWLEVRRVDLDTARGMLLSPHGEEADAYARAGYVSGLEQAKRVYGR